MSSDIEKGKTMSILTGGLTAARQYQGQQEGQLRAGSANAAQIESLARSLVSNPLYAQIIAESSNMDDMTQTLLREGALDVASSFDKAQGAMEREAGRMGVSPNSGRFAGMSRQWALARAAAEAGARTRARRSAEDMGWQRKLQGFGAITTAQNAAVGAAGTALQGRRMLASDYGQLGEEAGFQGTIGGGGLQPTVSWGQPRRIDMGVKSVQRMATLVMPKQVQSTGLVPIREQAPLITGRMAAPVRRPLVTVRGV